MGLRTGHRWSWMRDDVAVGCPAWWWGIGPVPTGGARVGSVGTGTVARPGRARLGRSIRDCRWGVRPGIGWLGHRREQSGPGDGIGTVLRPRASGSPPTPVSRSPRSASIPGADRGPMTPSITGAATPTGRYRWDGHNIGDGRLGFRSVVDEPRHEPGVDNGAVADRRFDRCCATALRDGRAAPDRPVRIGPHSPCRTIDLGYPGRGRDGAFRQPRPGRATSSPDRKHRSVASRAFPLRQTASAGPSGVSSSPPASG